MKPRRENFISNVSVANLKTRRAKIALFCGVHLTTEIQRLLGSMKQYVLICRLYDIMTKKQCLLVYPGTWNRV